LGVSDKRAKLIARDQSNKLYGDLTELRAKFNGWEFYEWDDSDDSRVRDDHKRLDGKIYKFSEPPVTVTTGKRAGERNNAGQDIQCRCLALIVFDRTVISLLKRQPDGSYAVPAVKAA
jgi:SPP1 gp7 family putative phage head morphogenesis protein